MFRKNPNSFFKVAKCNLPTSNIKYLNIEGEHVNEMHPTSHLTTHCVSSVHMWHATQSHIYFM